MKHKKLHFQNKLIRINPDGSFKLKWCVITDDGEKLTDWISLQGARVAMGKIIAERRRESWALRNR